MAAFRGLRLLLVCGLCHHRKRCHAVKVSSEDYLKLDIENPIIRINTAFKGCSSLEKISVLPRIYHN